MIMIKPQPQNWYKSLIKSTEGLPSLVTAIVHPVDELSLLGALESARLGIITPVFVGPAARIKNVAESIHVDISGYEIVDTMHSGESAAKSVILAKTGRVEALMKGKIHTDEFLHPIVDHERGLRTNRRLSHVFAMEVPYYNKPLFLTDAVVNIFPKLEEKRDIVQNAIDLFKALGLGIPKVAIVSATENVESRIPSTLDATALCKMSERGQITDGILDGPLGFDLAVSAESAKVKGIKSQVAGDADIILAPDLESGNMLYKQMAFLAHIESAGIVLGSSVPIILTSRSSDVESRAASSAMAAIYARCK